MIKARSKNIMPSKYNSAFAPEAQNLKIKGFKPKGNESVINADFEILSDDNAEKMAEIDWKTAIETILVLGGGGFIVGFLIALVVLHQIGAINLDSLKIF